jgi:hypothetical protein
MTRFVTTCFIWTLALVACSPVQKPPSLIPVNWEPGKTYRLQVSISDSGVLSDTSFKKISREYGVMLTILDTADGATLEWQELLADEATGAFTIPSTRIVYRTGRNGRFDRVLNYDELHAYADTMATMYLEGAGADSAMASAIKAAPLDSVTLLSNLLKQIHLFHRLYGATFSSDSIGETASWPDLLTHEATPGQCVLRANYMCDADDGLLSICAWESPAQVNATAAITAFLGEAVHQADSTGKEIIDNMGVATVSDSVNMCFLESECIPVHIEQFLTSVLSSGTFERYIYIGLVSE